MIKKIEKKYCVLFRTRQWTRLNQNISLQLGLKIVSPLVLTKVDIKRSSFSLVFAEHWMKMSNSKFFIFKWNQFTRQNITIAIILYLKSYIACIMFANIHFVLLLQSILHLRLKTLIYIKWTHIFACKYEMNDWIFHCKLFVCTTKYHFPNVIILHIILFKEK